MSIISNFVIEVVSQSKGNMSQYHQVKNKSVTLGRGYHNDIIINDPFICGDHLKIEFISEDEHWIIEELDTENGLAINGKSHNEKSFKVTSGDYIRIGKTTIKLYKTNHEVTETQKLIKQHGVFSMLEKASNSWLLFFMSIALFASYSYMGLWEKDSVKTVILMSIVWAVISLIWTACWSLAGKFNKHKSYFAGQLGIVSLSMIGSAVIYTIHSYIDFLVNNDVMSIISKLIIDVTFACLILYSCLNFASNITAKKRAKLSAAFSIGFVIGIWAIGALSVDAFSIKPKYSTSLKPYISNMVKENNIETYMQGNKKIFEDDDLKINTE